MLDPKIKKANKRNKKVKIKLKIWNSFSCLLSGINGHVYNFKGMLVAFAFRVKPACTFVVLKAFITLGLKNNNWSHLSFIQFFEAKINYNSNINF